MKDSILFLSLLILSSCNFYGNGISKKVSKVVDEIAKGNSVESKIIGIGGKISTQYQRFQRLSAIASNHELIRLTNHPNPVVRIYSFRALALKSPSVLDSIMIAHQNDSERVTTLTGCIQSSETVNQKFKSMLMVQENKKTAIKD